MMLLVALAVLSVTASSPPIDGPKTRLLKIVAGDTYLRAPERVPAGAVRIRFIEEGQTAHHLLIARLSDGVTIDDIDRASEDGSELSWVRFRPVDASPLRRSREVVADLAPGHYALVVLTEGSGSEPIRRQIRPLTVTAGTEELPNGLRLGWSVVPGR